jgi:hypothetical protein
MDKEWDINEFEDIKAHHYCKVEEDDKEHIQTIYFCHDHYLRQKALEYNMEMK